MDHDSKLWKEISPSQYEWERAALAFVKQGLPDHEPYRAWSNFEFTARDGRIYEVDLLVLAPSGCFLIEIKSRPGIVDGDGGTWRWTASNGARPYLADNPLLLANRKSKRLAELLEQTPEFKRHRQFVRPIVFLSDPSNRLRLQEGVAASAFLRDDLDAKARDGRPGIVAMLTAPPAPAAYASDRPINREAAKAFSRAMEQAGVRHSVTRRMAADHELEAQLSEGPFFQDWKARHRSLKSDARIRIYHAPTSADPSVRETVSRAAKREFEILRGIDHPGILRASHFAESELGPALVFDFVKDEARLDRWFEERRRSLNLSQRLELLSQIIDALKFAQGRRLFHRALSPACVLVASSGSGHVLKVFNWQTASREIETTTRGVTLTRHMDRLVSPATEAYLAPEALMNPDSDPEPLDVFGLGAIAYLLLTGRPPASDPTELAEKLRRTGGLELTASEDAVPEELRKLVYDATRADVYSRLDSVAEFARVFEEAYEKLTRPDEAETVDPARAQKGDRLQGGFRVVRRLGVGSTAVALLVERDDRQAVLKVAHDSSKNATLRAEAEVLKKLRHPQIVGIDDVLEVDGRTALLLYSAGDATLADRLRKHRVEGLELVERFGVDLLLALEYLEQEGVAHRDVKPDNLGVCEQGKDKKAHLVLFDFSLSRSSPENIEAGTPPYLDPFLALRKPRRWDTSAERYAAAVTLYEMTVGRHPRFGDGKSDPSVIKDEASIDGADFDVAVRAPLAEFFRRALRRDAKERFGSAEEMLNAWRAAFAADRREPSVELPADIDERTLVESLGLSARAKSALEKLRAQTVSELLDLDWFEFSRTKGVGKTTINEVRALRDALLRRFPGRPAQSAAAKAPPQPAAATPPSAAAPAASGLEALALRLAPVATRAGERNRQRIVEAFLGLVDDVDGRAVRPWMSRVEIAAAVDLTVMRVNQVLTDARKSWENDADLIAVRAQLVEALRTRGGALTAEEASFAAASTVGSLKSGAERDRLAAAAVRASLETEARESDPRFQFVRLGARIFIAAESVDGRRIAGADWSARLARLGAIADEIAAAETPLSAADAAARLRDRDPLVPLAPDRLIALAVAAARTAALSPRMEVYRRGMRALRALQLAQSALVSEPELSRDALRERVARRFPEAEALPEGSALDDLVRQAGLDLDFVVSDDGRGAYRWRRFGPTMSSASTLEPRRKTASDARAERSPEDYDAEAFEQRLARADREGAFLALIVRRGSADRLAEELARRFAVDLRSADALFLQALQELAGRAGVAWRTILDADAAALGEDDHARLRDAVREVLPEIERALERSERTLVLRRPGLFARFDALAVLERLRDRVGHGRDGARLHGLWVIVPSEAAPAGPPKLDGRPIPVITPAQWAVVPESWLENRHRGAALPAT